MKMITEKDLIRREWWWRHENPLFTFDPKTYTTKAKPEVRILIAGKEETIDGPSFWRSGVERAAWKYELMRRVSKCKSLPRYDKLNETEKIFLTSCLGQSEFVFTHTIYSPRPKTPEPGMWEAAGIFWNLRATDGALKGSFLNLIHKAREQHGIKQPKHMMGRKTHPVSWLWPEALDLIKHELHVGNLRFDHSTRSKARRQGREAEKIFWARLKACRKHGFSVFNAADLWPKIKL